MFFVKTAVTLALIMVIGVGMIGSAYAHKSEVVGNYKFEVGWDKEPPVAGKPNSIVVLVSKIEPTEKSVSKAGNTKHQQHEQESAKVKYGVKKSTKSNQNPAIEPRLGISGLGNNLEVDVTLNGRKSFLTMVENKDKPGTYLGTYQPDKEGYPIVHLYGKLDKKDVEITFHPEKILAK